MRSAVVHGAYKNPICNKKGGNNVQIGITELLLVFIVALIALGPDRLPSFAKKLGESVS